MDVVKLDTELEDFCGGRAVMMNVIGGGSIQWQALGDGQGSEWIGLGTECATCNLN